MPPESLQNEDESPIDPSLMTRWRKLLGDGSMEKRVGLKLHRTYGRAFKKALVKCGRYFHTRQNKRAMCEVRRLKTMLGRVIRDIGRKIASDAMLMQFFDEVLSLAARLHNQKKNDKNKICSIYAPEVECALPRARRTRNTN